MSAKYGSSLSAAFPVYTKWTNVSRNNRQAEARLGLTTINI